MAQLILVLAPFQTLNINEITFLDILLVLFFLSYFVNNKLDGFVNLISPNIIIFSILIIGIFNAYINGNNTSLSWLISIKVIEFYYFFKIAFKINIDERTLTNSILFCIFILLVWVAIYYVSGLLFGTHIISRVDFPFEYSGGQQLPCALFILNAFYYFMLRRNHSKNLYLIIIPIYFLSLFASFLSGGRAGILGMIFLLLIISNLKYILISLIPIFLLSYYFPLRLIENSFLSRVDLLETYLGNDLIDINKVRDLKNENNFFFLPLDHKVIQSSGQ